MLSQLLADLSHMWRSMYPQGQRAVIECQSPHDRPQHVGSMCAGSPASTRACSPRSFRCASWQGSIPSGILDRGMQRS